MDGQNVWSIPPVHLFTERTAVTIDALKCRVLHGLQKKKRRIAQRALDEHVGTVPAYKVVSNYLLLVEQFLDAGITIVVSGKRIGGKSQRVLHLVRGIRPAGLRV